jgi:two-component system, NtrC family, response regulator AtoC
MSSDGLGLCVSSKMQPVRELVAKVAATNTTVLLRGESGSGKEIVARAIHKLSPRANKQFLKVNCAALPSELLESELFGHEKGAFTGAYRQKPGKFEAADGGTLLLDEIGEMPLRLQAKLLHVLQDGEFSRVGGEKIIGTDVRLIASTNRDLEAAMRTHQFREDLYYRLNVIEIRIPPIRERREEIPVLVEHFRRKFNAQYVRNVEIPPDTVRLCMEYHWPGNVRELENIMARSVALASEPVVQLDQIPLDVALAPAEPTAEDQLNLREARHEVERLLILRALDRAGGNQTVAARLLGMHRNTLLVKLAQLGLRATEPGGAQSASSS